MTKVEKVDRVGYDERSIAQNEFRGESRIRLRTQTVGLPKGCLESKKQLIGHRVLCVIAEPLLGYKLQCEYGVLMEMEKVFLSSDLIWEFEFVLAPC